jgi:hypothetical protein
MRPIDDKAAGRNRVLLTGTTFSFYVEAHSTAWEVGAMVLEFRPFDADNHYYEPLDAFMPGCTGSDGPHANAQRFFDRLAARPPRSSGT